MRNEIDSYILVICKNVDNLLKNVLQLKRQINMMTFTRQQCAKYICKFLRISIGQTSKRNLEISRTSFKRTISISRNELLVAVGHSNGMQF